MHITLDIAMALSIDETEVDVAIAEAIAVIPRNTCMEDKGAEIRKALSAMGYQIVKGMFA
jgi:hypothetical protein